MCIRDSSTYLLLSADALILSSFAAQHQNTHTYRLSNLLKISTTFFPPRRRFLRQQQRSEIMNHHLTPVKHVSNLFFEEPSKKPPNRLPPYTAGKPVAAGEGAL